MYNHLVVITYLYKKGNSGKENNNFLAISQGLFLPWMTI
jgi:hypothetical protein